LVDLEAGQVSHPSQTEVVAELAEASGRLLGDLQGRLDVDVAGLALHSAGLSWYDRQRARRPRRRGREQTMGNPVVHFEVIGIDGPKLQKYYSELFEWEIDDSNEMNYGVVPREGNTNGEGIGIGGGVAGGPEGYGGHVTFYVEVPDVEASLAKAESLGGKRVFGPDTIMERMVLGQFLDPEGHVIGLIKGNS
jgi:Predicted enzyme related to lactoylglutathione lyase